MASLLEWFNNEIYTKNDPRTSEWFLVSRPGMLFAIILFYIYFCTSAGPNYMKNKSPYSLRTIIIVYNCIQILMNMYLFYEGLMAGWLYEYSYRCQPIDYSESPSAMRMARGVHLYFLCKMIDLLDTVLFVLRKKNNQISFLHLFHHTTILTFSWIAVRYFPGGHATFVGLLNSFVHVIMYSYYLLAALGPKVQKYLWWKQYVTLLQIVQFLTCCIHSGQVLITDCDYPKSVCVFGMFYGCTFLYMFGSFYIENYVKSKSNVKLSSSSMNSHQRPKSA